MDLKKISLFLSLFFLLSVPAFAEKTAAIQPIIADQCTTAAQTDDLPGILEAARGCCSHHGGMSGQCSNGRVVCRDGSISPTCKCRADSEIPADKG
ncbi:MAG TPA: hypothetical protein VEZ52_14110 [Desulfovibrio sp.]|uniref:hypothetical protein n=1 Tax=Desulfovibrio sp. TaxID=885 RepID=UPI002D5A2EEF|nr:hypothetical protein [Desulfovibrio sp.]HZF62738.1 hypothetical protein [Desulfovibrio sp.]